MTAYVMVDMRGKRPVRWGEAVLNESGQRGGRRLGKEVPGGRDEAGTSRGVDEK